MHADEIKEASIQMHTPLLPYSSWDVQAMNKVLDFPLLHFGVYNRQWIHYKTIYYQMLDVHRHRSKSAVSLYRTYHKKEEWAKAVRQPLRQEWFDGMDIFALIDITSTPIFVDYMRELVKEDGTKKFVSLDIWNDDIMNQLSITDPRRCIDKLMHWYLRNSNKHTKAFIIRAIDYILKKFY